MRRISGAPDHTPIDKSLLALLRERATQVRLAVGLAPQLYWLAPHYYKQGQVFYVDHVVALEWGPWTSEDVAMFMERFVPETSQRELEKTGETKVEFDFRCREKSGTFVAMIHMEDESTHIMVRLAKEK